MSRGGSKSLQKASLCHKKSAPFTLMIGVEYRVQRRDRVSEERWKGCTVIIPSIKSLHILPLNATVNCLHI